MQQETFKIYIVLSMSGTLFSRFLNLFMKSEFVHVSISLDKNLKTLYSFGRKKINTPWNAGFIEEHLDKGIFDMYNSMCEVLELELSKDEYNLLVEKLEDIISHSDEYKYNFKGLFYTYFNVPKTFMKRFTCTQFVAYLLQEIGALNIEKDASLVLPKDYYDLNVRCVFRGRVHDYRG